MNRSMLVLPGAIILVWIFALVIDAAPPAREREGKCGQWEFGACQNMSKSTCGRGLKKGTRTGDGCVHKEKTESCKVPCPGDKKMCKYRKGSFGECSQETLKRTRIDTLMTELSDPTCEAKKKTEKICRRKCTFGPWVDGECIDGKLTSTRVIQSGGGEECRRKATKTKRCGGAAGGRRRGGGRQSE